MTPIVKIVVTSAHMECGMCPTVIVGITVDGSSIYARYRFGHLTIRLDARNPAAKGGAEGRQIFAKKLDPDGLAGWLDYEDLQEITADLIKWPDKISPGSDDNHGEISLI